MTGFAILMIALWFAGYCAYVACGAPLWISFGALVVCSAWSMVGHLAAAIRDRQP